MTFLFSLFEHHGLPLIYFFPEAFVIICVVYIFVLNTQIGFGPKVYDLITYRHFRSILALVAQTVFILLLLYFLLLGVFDNGLSYPYTLYADLFEFFSPDFNFLVILTLAGNLGYWNFCFKIILSLSFLIYLAVVFPSFFFDEFFKFEIAFFLFLSFLGLIGVFSVSNFMGLYLVLELSSFCFYTLSGFKTRGLLSTEAALKYFILSSVASLFFLFGLTFVYFVTGTLNFDFLKLQLGFFTDFYQPTTANLQLTEIFGGFENMLFGGLTLIVFALLIKVGAAPFHFWIPDVYDGSPTFVTYYFSTVAKIGYIGALARVYWEVLSPLFNNFSIGLAIDWQFFLIGLCSIISVIVGSLGAFFQLRIKRWIAYSGIVHVGFLLAALTLGADRSFTCLIFFFYLLVYLIIVNIFFIFIFSSRGLVKANKKIDLLSDLRFVFNSNRSDFTVFLGLGLLSWSAVPPLLGFFSKAAIVGFLINDHYYLYSLLLIFFSILSTFYYIRLFVYLVFDVTSYSRASGSFQYLNWISTLLLASLSFFNIFGFFYLILIFLKFA